MNTFDALIDAKARRDLIRGLLVKELQAHRIALSDDLRALLQADGIATADLARALVTR